MRVGFDFHNVLDAYPSQISNLISNISSLDYVCVISAITKNRIGTISAETFKICPYVDGVFEVVFKNAKESPALKVTQALALNLDMFFDDRQDVCDAMNAAGILCFKVPRPGDLSDVEAEVK